ncbi:TetR/AcrR family transcriptional regulator [Sphingomonas cavernae]|uniref:TetR/AcrR family transcriptional regulator n=1 Tax=Sphingomonas cavernae TaxID=2320861 RepID=A0A418WMD1_9SPHN|nr:TetR/AcrR family transcriptional regulator [Sphingomonas cavernae]RJF91173.1 TetR/AcrR family transcriptional regulator [Sphingomonas cavernae]
MNDTVESRKPNRGYDETHRALIETAVRLISEKGADALSIAALARATSINRTTVYYHFSTRDALLRAVRHWSSEQLVAAFNDPAPQDERIDHLSRFVLQNPELIKLWIEDFVSGSDIRESYPQWDALVKGVTDLASTGRTDAEIFCTILITGAVIGPRVFRNAVRPDASDAEIMERFRREQQRLLRDLSLTRGEDAI